VTQNLDLRNVRAIVTDADVLGRLAPDVVAAYLRRTGWTPELQRQNGTIWGRELQGGRAAVALFLPDDQTHADYAIRLGALLTTLALAEDRSQLAILTELQGDGSESMTAAVELIASERRRQIEAEGYDEAHDDRHDRGELIEAARCYAYAAQVAEWDNLADWFGIDAEGRIKLPAASNARWPWSPRDWKPTGDPVRDLTMAGALVAAEIDRLLRKAAREAQP
jgi:hypothetical protein